MVSTIQTLGAQMYIPFASGTPTTFEHSQTSTKAAVAHSEPLDALVALEQIGTRHCFERGKEIYAEGDVADCWYRLVSGAVRIYKLLANGRRHIGQFCFADDCFGIHAVGPRAASAASIGDVVVTRFPQHAAGRLIAEKPLLARELYDRTLRELVNAQRRTLLLGRMTASERVASFLIEVSERHDSCHVLELPMTRSDIADYLGMSIETVCRELSALKRDGVIASSKSRSARIELRDRNALEVLCEGARENH
jgi:CRP/FNR family transcriptional regulator, nitrogen fixation regulation protein